MAQTEKKIFSLAILMKTIKISFKLNMFDLNQALNSLRIETKEIVGNSLFYYRDRLGHQWVSEMMLNAQSKIFNHLK
jgi:hypothetical protein